MNFLFNRLKSNFDHRPNGEEFLNALIDEEYVTGEKLNMCYFCDFEKFDIVRGGIDVYKYIGDRMSNMKDYYENDKEELHHLGLLCNWLNFHGVPIFAKAEEFPDLAILICKHCGRILAVNLDKWYFPYCGYLDEIN